MKTTNPSNKNRIDTVLDPKKSQKERVTSLLDLTVLTGKQLPFLLSHDSIQRDFTTLSNRVKITNLYAKVSDAPARPVKSIMADASTPTESNIANMFGDLLVDYNNPETLPTEAALAAYDALVQDPPLMVRLAINLLDYVVDVTKASVNLADQPVITEPVMTAEVPAEENDDKKKAKSSK